ncbi:MAG: hypothetical protein H0U13_13685, partial [Gemmatimonadaceae bacterium]|nr:hypothetical protein [Gemmatimonadaceae bacterium]
MPGQSPADQTVVLVRAPTRDLLRAGITQLRARLGDDGDSWRDLAATSLSPGDSDLCLAIVTSSLPDLIAKLDLASSRLAEPGRNRIRDPSGIYFESAPLGGPVAVLFPGEGSEYEGALSDLRIEFRDVDIMLSATERRDERGDMARAVATVLGGDLALWQVLRKLEIPADAMLGHSTGELAALIASGMIDVPAPADLERFGQDLEQLAGLSPENLPSVVLIAAGTD